MVDHPLASAPFTVGIVELRQYAMRPGGRDVLMELFERELVETQEAEGMAVLGHFRDLDHPDQFVWLRGFEDMDTRDRGLRAFYGGPVWARHRQAANATMEDSDDVLLLRRIDGSTALLTGVGPRPGARAVPPETLITITVWSLRQPMDDGTRQVFRDELDPVLASTGSVTIALLETENATNTFPELPVRESEQVVVRVARFDDVDAYESHRNRLADSADWRARSVLLSGLTEPAPLVLRLAPAARSLLR